MKVSYLDRRALSRIYNNDRYLQTKTLDDIPKPVLQQIKLISLPIDKQGSPFGSYINRMADYYGDIDVIQLIDNFKSIKEVGPKTAKAIQMVIAEIEKKKYHWFSEFKAGIDHSYYFDYGTLQNGVYRPSKLLAYKSEVLYRLKLLSDKEINIIRLILSKKVKTGDDYDLIYNLFREHFVLRWSLNEIKQGWKQISIGKYKLSDAVMDKSAVKIDMIVFNDTKFIEVTNFIALGINENGYFKSINIEDSALTPANLPVEVEKLYYSNFYYKPFKMVKRAFAYLKWLNKTKKVNVDPYVKILKSTIAILYTVSSEIEAIKIVLPMKASVALINKRLNLLKDPISNVLEIDSEQLQSIMLLLDEVIKADKNKLELLGALNDIFKQIINFWTIAYMDQLRLNPPPNNILPTKITYDRQIFREPWSNPVNPFKEVKGGCPDCNGTCGGSWFGDIASSIFQKAANAYRRNFCDGKSRPLEKGEYHYGCHNFTGPGTRVDLPKVRNFKPFNDIDACSKQHDIDYERAVELPDKERIAAITKADKDVVECYKKYPNENGSTVAQLGINSKMSLAKVLPIVSKSLFGKISASGKIKGEVTEKDGIRTLNL